MAVRDLETVLVQAVDLIKANLNTALAAIAAEKGDGFTMADVPADGYFFQEIGTTMPNVDPCVFFNASSAPEETVGRESSEAAKLLVELVTSEQGYSDTDNSLFKLLWRYRRAIHASLKGNWDRFSVLKAENVPDLPFARNDGQTERLWSVGVVFTFKHVI